ncbi:class I SAM-dependent methyltransferase [Cryptosporangium phraense]|uniref:Class I SAM-dependent methyltransferase n=1 Tax=Cryptosporangium phraense TaxID=2593070 RepID=A0A545AUG3_9ACTN|nr:class I SAM-dependent methyltransferase [Cryptosporangium phraense]TQS44976.1 class I SAM-dependent methyltransferase [Cryptosporangium phraense]
MRADYGVDAPPALYGLGAAALLSGVVTTVVAVLAPGGWWLIPLAYALFFLASFGSFLYTTRRGKFVVWDELLAGAGPAARIVDLGCGRGAVLIKAAAHGRALGVDLWRSVDQSGNDPARTAANAAAEGVRIDLVTGDLRNLPLASAEADLVVSSLAIHNIPNAEGRLAAVREAARILRPGGRMILVDFRHTRDYAAELSRSGLTDVRVRPLGWRFWYGGPWGAAAVVTASRAGDQLA